MSKVKNILIGDAYFEINPDNILGTIKIVSSRFGKKDTKVLGNSDNLDKIIVPDAKKYFTEIPKSNLSAQKPDNKETIEDRIEKVFENERKKAIKEKLDKYIDPAEYNKEIYSFKEIVEIYNPNISNDELQAWLFTNPNLPAEKYLGNKGITITEDELLQKGLICYNDGSFEYKYKYISGNIAKKLSYLKRDKEYIIEVFGEKVFKHQKELLDSAIPTRKHFKLSGDDAISLHAYSELASIFMLLTTNSYSFDKPTSIKDIFKKYIKDVSPSEIKGTNANEIIDYYIDNKKFNTKKLKEKSEDEIESLKIYTLQKSQEQGFYWFNRFIVEELYEQDRIKLEIIWNEQFNSYAEVDLDKIPVGFTFSKYFKDKSPLRLSNTQRNGVAFITSVKSGVLAYDVGVGKTLSAIAAISYLYENNFCKYPLIVVPNIVYKKWILEIKGGRDEKTKKYLYGALPHYNLRLLGNMNIDYIMSEKIYSKKERADIDKILERKKIIAKLIKEVKDKPIYYNEISPVLFNLGITDEINRIIKTTDEIIRKFSSSFGKGIYKPDFLKVIPMFDLIYSSSEGQKIENSIRKILNIDDKKAQKNISFSHFIYDYAAYLLDEDFKYLIYNTGIMKPIDEGTITLMTEEALQKLGFDNDEPIVQSMYSILENVDIEDTREEAALYERIRKNISSKVGGNKFPVEQLNIDAFIFDEAHHARKLITSLKASNQKKVVLDENGYPLMANGEVVYEIVKDDKGNTKKDDLRHKIGNGGDPSNKAIVSYAISKYVQFNNVGRNVIYLTATPFENNPLEVYSVLSSVNNSLLVERGFENIHKFFETFMRIEYVLSIKANKIKKSDELVGYRNLPQFRSLIRSVINYITGEEANVLRPNKIVIPNKELAVNSSFVMSDMQQFLYKQLEEYILKKNKLDFEIYEDIFDEFIKWYRNYVNNKILKLKGRKKEIYKEKTEQIFNNIKKLEIKGTHFSDFAFIQRNPNYDIDEKGIPEGIKTIKSMTWMRSIVISPFLFPFFTKSNIDVTPEDFIETSPKLRYVMQCIKSVKEYHEATNTDMSGQVIYMDMGVDYIHKIKQYLINKDNGFGYEKNEVEIISGKHNSSTAAKEKIKKRFLSGEIKILIGTKSIEVGVDLQENASVMYMLTFPYNPTEQKQVEGRIWRQGNRFNNVRIVFPMLENSIDPIMFQYLGIKTSRLKDIWDKEGVRSQLDLRDFDPETLKKEMITDPNKKIQIEMLEIEDKFKTEIAYLNAQKDEIKRALQITNDFQQNFDAGINALKEIYEAYYDARRIEAIEYYTRIIDKNEHDIELRKEDDAPAKAKTEKAKEKEKERIENAIKRAKEKIAKAKEDLERAKDDARAEYENYIAILENEGNRFDKFEHLKELNISPVRYAKSEILSDKGMNRPVLRRTEFDKIRLKRSFYDQTVTRFKASIVDYIKLHKNILEPLGATENDIPVLDKKIDAKILEKEKEADNLEDFREKRYKELVKEFEEKRKNFKNEQERAIEFAKLNPELLSDCRPLKKSEMQVVKNDKILIFAVLNSIYKKIA